MTLMKNCAIIQLQPAPATLNMEQQQNAQYLIKRWLPILIFDLILFSILITATIHDLLSFQDKLSSYLCAIFVLLFFLVMIWIYLNTTTKIRRLLLFPSPQPLISFFTGKSRISQLTSLIIPSRKPLLASQIAFIYSLYGQFENARMELQKIEWKNWPPIIQAEKLYIESILEYLEKHDFQQGLAKAQEARRLSQISPHIPIEKMPFSGINLSIKIGQALCGVPDPGIIVTLESKLHRYPMLGKILIAWALEQVYNKNGRIVQANRMRELIDLLAPHCAGLARI